MLTEEQIKYKNLENLKCELFNDNFENFKRYGIPKAQLIIAGMYQWHRWLKEVYLELRIIWPKTAEDILKRG